MLQPHWQIPMARQMAVFSTLHSSQTQSESHDFIKETSSKLKSGEGGLGILCLLLGKLLSCQKFNLQLQFF